MSPIGITGRGSERPDARWGKGVTKSLGKTWGEQEKREARSLEPHPRITRVVNFYRNMESPRAGHTQLLVHLGNQDWSFWHPNPLRLPV